mmetsp:Transcript_59022/g.111200  ORF Transcript_59022/g.111200 Transcript_59022/m.111200 type:complete len:1557 (+) Transcript_59022:340-5010(+)
MTQTALDNVEFLEARRGNKDDMTNEELNRWDLFLETNSGFNMKAEEPHTLEIAYSPVKGKVVHEVVFEDPTEADKRPRLLVSLQSVLALKSLCEREFDRVEVITELLKCCRTAYYKELCYLREQLTLAMRPQGQAGMEEHVHNYEVYWYDPPEYIDADMKAFLQDCIRLTNKKLIEENFELLTKIKDVQLAAGNQGGGLMSDEAMIQHLIRKLGPGGLVRKTLAMLKESGSEAKLADFLKALGELSKPKVVEEDDMGLEKDEDNPYSDKAQLRKLRKELEEYRKKEKEMDELRKKAGQLELQLEEAQKSKGTGTAIEKARADAEKQRAEEEAARAEALSVELEQMKQQMSHLEDLGIKFKKAGDQMGTRLSMVADRMSKNGGGAQKGYGGLDPENPLAKAEVATQNIEAALTGILTAKPVVTKTDDEASARQIENLEAQIKAAREREARLKVDCERLKKKLEEAQKKPEVVEVKEEKENPEVIALRKELAAMKEDIEKAAQREAELKEDMEKSNKRFQKLKDSYKDFVPRKMVDEAEAIADELTQRLQRAQDKIYSLKDEIKKWRMLAGGPAEDSDDEDDDSDIFGDIPKFLLSYVKRNRHSLKPRWQQLSEDARCARQKRDFLWAQRHNPAEIIEELGDAANAAFQFLRDQELKEQGRRTSGGQMGKRAPKLRVRSHSTVLADERVPLEKAMEFARNVMGGSSPIAALQAMSGEDQYCCQKCGTPFSLPSRGQDSSEGGAGQAIAEPAPAPAAALAAAIATTPTWRQPQGQQPPPSFQSPISVSTMPPGSRSPFGGESKTPTQKGGKLPATVRAGLNPPLYGEPTPMVRSFDSGHDYAQMGQMSQMPQAALEARSALTGSSRHSDGEQQRGRTGRPAVGPSEHSGRPAGANSPPRRMVRPPSRSSSANSPPKVYAASPVAGRSRSPELAKYNIGDPRGGGRYAMASSAGVSPQSGAAGTLRQRDDVAPELLAKLTAVGTHLPATEAEAAVNLSSETLHKFVTEEKARQQLAQHQQRQQVAASAAASMPGPQSGGPFKQGSALAEHLRALAEQGTIQHLPGAEGADGVHLRKFSAPTNPDMVYQIRPSGLMPLETPTEWAVDSRKRAPTPTLVERDVPANPNPPAAEKWRPRSRGADDSVDRSQSRSQPPSARSRPPSRPPSRNISPATRALVPESSSPDRSVKVQVSVEYTRKELSRHSPMPGDPGAVKYGPRVTELVAHQENAAGEPPGTVEEEDALKEMEGTATNSPAAAAVSSKSFGATPSSEKGISRFFSSSDNSTRASESASPLSTMKASRQSNKSRTSDLLPMEASVDSVATVLSTTAPSTTSRESGGRSATSDGQLAASMSSSRSSGWRKSTGSRKQPARQEPIQAPRAFGGSPLSSSAGFQIGYGTYGSENDPKRTITHGMSSSTGFHSGAEGGRSPPSRSATAQVRRTLGSPQEAAGSPPKQRRTQTAGATASLTRDGNLGHSRSTGSLPLTNAARERLAGGRGGSGSPVKQRRSGAPGAAPFTDSEARAAVAAASNEGVLPEVLPALPPGKIRKGVQSAMSWVVV